MMTAIITEAADDRDMLRDAGRQSWFTLLRCHTLRALLHWPLEEGYC